MNTSTNYQQQKTVIIFNLKRLEKRLRCVNSKQLGTNDLLKLVRRHDLKTSEMIYTQSKPRIKKMQSAQSELENLCKYFGV